MNDRELIESAARAAGLSMHRYCEPWKAMARYTLSDGYHGPSWNPLTDDGDAFRLAVKLHLRVCPFAANPEGIAYISHDGIEAATVEHKGDPYSATRRAIVIAAAALGAQSGEAL